MMKKWPLHPKPYEYQLLYNWTKTLAEIYGVSHRSFCQNVLGLESHEISDLRSSLPEKAIIKLQVPIYTADRIWAELQLDGADIKLIR